ncbi:2-oxoglutarate-dependent dioxygenase htyE [Holothuria leucospilota]|uniref:2-oxoglutarate-dependent dioxygenase htyE n=1 Tax=Holothuria leucospilota TaxID=206669 RepID=A0A9Q1BS25_HOLLE|nr:2-oxoglutarate-dependent dioxygenase htyE [Holothuria leucospilota]
MDQERLDTTKRHLELKECYNYLPHDVQEIEPDVLRKTPECSELVNTLQKFFEHGKTLSNRVLELIARGLHLQDPYFFVKKHRYCGQKKGIVNVRSTYYPRINVSKVLEDQTRCGEHSDWGGITLLVQDAPGLEVRNLKGQWTPAPPIEGAILVLTGDLMQRWTSDRVIAAKHRVVFPASETEMQTSRQSITFFGHPDGDEIIECVDGSDIYRPIGSREYFDVKLKEIWTEDCQYSY